VLPDISDPLDSKRRLAIGRMILMLLLAIVATGCTNVVRSGLLNSNSVFLQPSADHSVYLQIRNTSEDQQFTLSDLPAKLTSKL
jgi:hypothetical protein